MALARVVTFEGVSSDRLAELDRELRDGQPPEGLPAKEIIVLHDPDAEQSVVIVFFDTEDDYTRGDAVLSAMPGAETPGRRTSVTKYKRRDAGDGLTSPGSKSAGLSTEGAEMSRLMAVRSDV